MQTINLSWSAPTDARDPERPSPDSGRVRDAAQQFEALLLAQMLRTVRESGGGWLGGGESSGNCATDFAEQQVAETLARQGGIGLADVIVSGLHPRE